MFCREDFPGSGIQNCNTRALSLLQQRRYATHPAEGRRPQRPHGEVRRGLLQAVFSPSGSSYWQATGPTRPWPQGGGGLTRPWPQGGGRIGGFWGRLGLPGGPLWTYLAPFRLSEGRGGVPPQTPLHGLWTEPRLYTPSEEEKSEFADSSIL